MRKKEIESKRRGASMVVAMAAAICCVGMSMVACNKGGGTPTPDKYDFVEVAVPATYTSTDDVLEIGSKINRQLAAEGFVLLKNANNTLPLAKAGAKVTVLGESAKALAYGGGGSGGQKTPGNASTDFSRIGGDHFATLYDSLDEAKIAYNPAVKTKYDGIEQGNNPGVTVPGGSSQYYYNKEKYMDKDASGTVSFGAQKYKDSENCCLKGAEIGEYNDAAILVISRSGSEGMDDRLHDVDGHTDKKEHYLTLNDSEREMMAYAKAHFDKVVVLLNTPAVMELKDLQDDDKIGGVLWIGQPGWNGIMAVGDILTGKVNPSGHTVDLWMSDFKTDPTWYNFGDYTQLDASAGKGYISGDKAPKLTKDENSSLTFADNAYSVDYAEGIYLGYRYYETVAKELGSKGEKWYADNVTYPFGYGLSYTTFTKSIKSVEGDLTKADGKIKVTVTVKNTGNAVGKDVVQIYDSAPYTKGGIEKAAVDLVGFAKSKMLKPGESQDVVVEFAVKDMAAFDYNDKNKNSNNGYELEEGEYVISLRENSHKVIEEKKLNRSGSALTWDEDGNPSTPNNIFSQESGTYEGSNTLSHHWTADGTDHYLTRDKLVSNGAPSDLTQLSWVLADKGNQMNDKAINYIKNWRTTDVGKDHDNLLTEEVETDYVNNWTKTDEDVKTFKQGQGVKNADGLYAKTIKDMIGKSYDDASWKEFIDQLTFEELKTITSNGGFRTAGLSTIDTTTVVDNDGPGQLKQSGTATASGYAYVCEVIVASTWNTDLAYNQGKVIGYEALWNGQTGWYGPGIDTHRNPLGGRNFEYYSQDGLQGGKIAAANIKGATEQGVHVYMKHAFMNDQETSRCDGLATFATEQAIRQIYARPLEIIMKEAGGNGTMTAFNFIGIDNSASYTITTQLYSNEWGYRGSSVTDMYSEGARGYAQSNPWTIVRGMTIPLNAFGQASIYSGATWETDHVEVNGAKSPTLWYWARETAHRVLYTMANDNAVAVQKKGYSPAKVNGAIDASDGLKNVKLGDTLTGKVLSDASIASLNTLLGEGKYNVSISGMPGVTCSEDGTLSGTVEQPMSGGWGPAKPLNLPASVNVVIRVALKGNDGYVAFYKTVACTVNPKDA